MVAALLGATMAEKTAAEQLEPDADRELDDAGIVGAGDWPNDALPKLLAGLL